MRVCSVGTNCDGRRRGPCSLAVGSARSIFQRAGPLTRRASADAPRARAAPPTPRSWSCWGRARKRSALSRSGRLPQAPRRGCWTATTPPAVKEHGKRGGSWGAVRAARRRRSSTVCRWLDHWGRARSSFRETGRRCQRLDNVQGWGGVSSSRLGSVQGTAGVGEPTM